ncbi:hypothetical protein [Streptacidiphilus anmyonensis]|uniref:hypothetical protein n=1 Tax=Streptacidiphilus anmyonensis TaxID=405782 RepID=UPI00128CA35D|nr:hypothetical protein [Streptacidiphilus anmyonensis]
MSAAGQPFADSEQGPSGGSEVVRYRARAWQTVVVAGAFALMAAAFLTDALARPVPGESWSERLAAAWPFALLTVEYGWLSFWVGVALTPEAAVVYRFRRRTVPWREIAEVAVEPFPLGGGRRVVLHLHDGTRIALRQPSTGFLVWDPRFDEKLAAIRSSWLAGGGTAWPESEVDEPPADSFRLRPSVLQRIYPSFPPALVAVEVGAGSQASGGSVVQHVVGGLVGLFLLGCASRFWFVGTTADRQRLVSRDLLGRRTVVPWADVRALRVVATRTARRLAVTDVSGRTLLLAAPRLGALLWDPGFQAKAEMLRRRWSELYPEAAATAPSPAPGESPRPWQRAVVGVIGLVYAFGAVMVLFLGLVLLLMLV